mmetsp:Transcript_51027/g.119355  ORF Transcript_51027/g.119355 Transcript_51027/m.119355 type:complete len:809 (-) Transcript_51027:92-2518(-)
MGCGASSNRSGPQSSSQPKQTAAGGSKYEIKITETTAPDAETVRFLQQVPLFGHLTADFHAKLATACVNQDFAQGEVVIQQGEPGEDFFIIRSGKAQVTVVTEEVDDQGNGGTPVPAWVACLTDGDYFGEAALLSNKPRAATVTAETKLQTIKLPRDKFQELELHINLKFAKRKAVAGGGAGPKIKRKEATPKSDEERTFIAAALNSNKALQDMLSLDDAKVNAMIDISWREEVPANTRLIKENDVQADYFYVIEKGEFGVWQATSGAGVVAGQGTAQWTLGPGASFGETALICLTPRNATVESTTDATVWIFDRDSFKSILMRTSNEKLRAYDSYLASVESLQSLLKEERWALTNALVERRFYRDDFIIKNGQQGTSFFLLYDGEVVELDENSVEKGGSALCATPKTSPLMFGEQALLNNTVHAGSVKVTSKIAKCLCLDRHDFQQLLGPLEDILTDSKEGTTEGERSSLLKKPGARMRRIMQSNERRIKLEELTKIGLLGTGGFSYVELYEQKKTGKTFALKVLSKGYIVQHNMQTNITNEKQCLAICDSPFIIRLYGTFNTDQYLYFLMEAALGGELYLTYQRKGFYGKSRHARFYAAGVVCAFEHMHQRKIIYRDMKPENLLLDTGGHLKLTDMGLAKFCVGKTYTTCGTPEYFAPELIASKGYTHTVDWWTLGILLFELMSGHSPFEATSPVLCYRNIAAGIQKVTFRAPCIGAVEDLIKGLLAHEPSERLPMRPGGVENICQHSWYHGFDWHAFREHELEPPYKPKVTTPKDLANFDATAADAPEMVHYVDDGSGWDKEFEM